MIELCDVSGWQSLKGSDYEAALAGGLGGIIAKLSQGERPSKKGAKHVAKALAAGLPVGAYHFADPLKKGLRTFRPIEQADTFCAAVDASGLLDGPWPFSERSVPRLWLDMEWKSFGRTKEGKARGRAFRRQFRPADVMRWSRLFIGRVQAELGHTCGIYTGRSYVKYRFAFNDDLRFYPFWRAGYVDVGDDRTGVPDSGRWPKPLRLRDDFLWPADLWQFTGRGSVPWYRKGKGKIDRNLAKLEDE